MYENPEEVHGPPPSRCRRPCNHILNIEELIKFRICVKSFSKKMLGALLPAYSRSGNKA